MDYEKKYNEAVKMAKEFLNSPRTCFDIEQLKDIFPELRESEDERIRKHLIAIVELYWGKTNDPDKAKDLAYLEKQKENLKSADSIPSDCVSDAKCEDRWYKVGDSLPANPREVLCKDEAGNYFIGRYYIDEGWEISNYDDEDKPHHLNPPVSKWIDFPSEKQKEQKPVEVKDPFSNANFVRGYESGYTDAIREQKPADLPPGFYFIDLDGKKYYSKEFRYGDMKMKIVEDKSEKPAEWKPTEEQFIYLAKAIMTLGEEGDCKTAGVLSEIRNGLKCSFPDWKMSSDYPEEGCNVSLNGEVKKIQEWSEEDRHAIENCEYAIKETFKDEQNPHRIGTLDWLKSLRPYWKPSEEQMEALQDSIDLDKTVFHRGKLVSLLEDLKKLM